MSIMPEPPKDTIWKHQKHNLAAGKLHVYRVICVTVSLALAKDRKFLVVAASAADGADHKIFQQSNGYVAVTFFNHREVSGTHVIYENVYTQRRWMRTLDDFMGHRHWEPPFEQLA